MLSFLQIQIGGSHVCFYFFNLSFCSLIGLCFCLSSCWQVWRCSCSLRVLVCCWGLLFRVVSRCGCLPVCALPWCCCCCSSFQACSHPWVVLVVSALVGFSGSRSLPASFSGVVQGLVSSVVGAGRGVAVGCAPGLDSMVRSACPSAQVFTVSGSGRGAFATRSVACVQAVAGSGSGAGWVSFPGCTCPNGLVPSPASSLCFCGLGSGSWASAALAAGLGVPVVVFGVPSSSLPSGWGRWVCAGSGPWASGFRLVPAVQQLGLFG